MNEALPYLVSAFGVILSALLAMALSKLSGMDTRLESFCQAVIANGKDIARMDEHMKGIDNKAQLAHERIDRIKATSS